jgi:hypothetical protein
MRTDIDYLAGVQVGSGTTPVTISDYALDTQIGHGSGAGQLTYQASETVDASISDDVYTLRHIKTFTNNSGDNVTVREVGIHAKQSTYYFLIYRHILDAAVVVPDGATLTVRVIETIDATEGE